MQVTFGNALVDYGSQQIYRQFGATVAVVSITLAAPFRGYPAGTRPGQLQTRHQKGQRTRTTHSERAAILGHDVAWLLREFQEHQCGDRQRRMEDVQPGKRYEVLRTFGVLSHDPCVYEPGTLVSIVAVKETTLQTRVLRGPRTRLEHWRRKTFDGCLETYALRDIE